jgi:hypothetical protein
MVQYEIRQLLPASMNEAIQISQLPYGEGRGVPHNSQDLISSEGVTQVSVVIFLCVSGYNTFFFCVFPQIFKLYVVVLTILATSVGDERSFSALKRLNNYLRRSQRQDRLSSLALISIEK